MPQQQSSPSPSFQGINTDWMYAGEENLYGELQLTELARSFNDLERTDLSPFFPDQTNPERTIIIEQRIEPVMGMMAVVEPGRPSGNFLQGPGRIRRRYVQPIMVREDDFLDQLLLNQMKRPGSFNEAYAPADIISERVQQLVRRHQNTIDYFRVHVILGGIHYTDANTNVTVDVPTHIPQHNLFKYDGWNDAVAADADIAGTPYKAAKALTNNKNRPEALFFTNMSGTEAAVPWTRHDADIVRSLRLIKHYLKQTNKNIFTHMILSGDLYTMLLENDGLRAQAGFLGNLDQQWIQSSGISAPPGSFVRFIEGDIAELCGLKIITHDDIIKDPETGLLRKVWPTHKVALIAGNHHKHPDVKLGRTQYCMGESPDETPGLWMRSFDHTSTPPPSPPGRSMQIGDAFMPFATYPEWISLIDVCEEGDLESGILLAADINFNLM
jgi:hypothetical protein